jgi:hypothetical protein
MNEDFLHFIWKYCYYNAKSLTTTAGENLEVLRPGEQNTDGGPDFLNARIRIGDTQWAGNIEIHLNSSDWVKHKHNKDKSYDNIILHVVYNNDFIVLRTNKEPIPVFELKELIPHDIYRKYLNILNSKHWIPCEGLIKQTSPLTIGLWMDRVLIERLERKTESISTILKLHKNSWENAFYIHLARNFGFKLNAEPFEMLSKATPLSNLIKHKNHLFQLEAMLFGQSGLLNKNMRDSYGDSLFQEYSILKQKFDLTPLNGHLWKFLRLQPSGFPTIRIAQFASLIYKSTHLFSKILDGSRLTDVEELFEAECSEYWHTHYVFGKESPRRSKRIGRSAIDNIIINTVVPFLFIYGVQKKEDKYKNRAIRFLEQMEGEKNAVITKWKFLGTPVKTAANTQALLELKNNYCALKRCLTCGIGTSMLKKSK